MQLIRAPVNPGVDLWQSVERFSESPVANEAPRANDVGNHSDGEGHEGVIPSIRARKVAFGGGRYGRNRLAKMSRSNALWPSAQTSMAPPSAPYFTSGNRALPRTPLASITIAASHPMPTT